MYEGKIWDQCKLSNIFERLILCHLLDNFSVWAELTFRAIDRNNIFRNEKIPLYILDNLEFSNKVK